MSREWFEKTFQGATSPAFETWWLKFYGKPEEYLDVSKAKAGVVTTSDDADDYWVRKAFAWYGWAGHALKPFDPLEAFAPGKIPQPKPSG